MKVKPSAGGRWNADDYEQSRRGVLACEDQKQRIWLEALGALEPAERSRLWAHLDKPCGNCLRELDHARAQSGAVLGTLTPLPPPHQVRVRLLEAARQSAEPARRSPERVKVGWLGRIGFGTAATVVGVVAALSLEGLPGATAPEADTEQEEEAGEAVREDEASPGDERLVQREE